MCKRIFTHNAFTIQPHTVIFFYPTKKFYSFFAIATHKYLQIRSSVCNTYAILSHETFYYCSFFLDKKRTKKSRRKYAINALLSFLKASALRLLQPKCQFTSLPRPHFLRASMDNYKKLRKY